MFYWMRIDTSKKINNFITAENSEIDGDKGFKYIKDNNGDLWVYLDDDFESHSKNVALGLVYNEELDAFTRPQPYPSWIFNEESGSWSAPIENPNDGNLYYWDEESTSWIAV